MPSSKDSPFSALRRPVFGMEQKPKNRSMAIALAFAGTFVPGLHKFYLRQPGWGMVYLLSGFTPAGMISRTASFVEAVWYLTQEPAKFDQNFNTGILPRHSTPQSSPSVDAEQVSKVAEVLREIDRLRQEGLISEYEFEQKRRNLLDRIG
jgi:TM2 domain-containing membrane protein YozV